MFNNLSCEKFKQDIDNVINHCGLPPVVAYYILKNSLYELEDICKDVMRHELKNPTEQQQEINIDLTDQQNMKKLEKSSHLLEEAE